ncbi:hypothetical protein QFZ53_002806 [Microbacterium natoriense]|uniref:DUF222 domain-containing protein n=1 Tax=Microbacterium natoriense TaxID=284570 RepID=A0AAW8EYT6_9MICO|nr:hypothetical protein [Microbacterium natoriense]MDQ0648610.1 hypothetical protein [Microbacterium natoriense]
MDREQLATLPTPDQWTFVRGRIAEAAVELDSALRGLHAQLRGLDTREALLSASQNWTIVADQCRTMIACAPVEDREIHAAIGAAIDSAAAAYDERNRYMHDLLAADVDDELIPDPGHIRQRGDFYLLRLTQKAGVPGVTVVTLEQAIAVVVKLSAETWRLRAARGYLAGRTTWRSLLLGVVEGEWDGTATWTFGGSEPDD